MLALNPMQLEQEPSWHWDEQEVEGAEYEEEEGEACPRHCRCVVNLRCLSC
jgi:hypothetical protein